MTDAVVVFITAPSQETAVTLGRALVEERLAACANIVPGLRSIYHWQGKVCDEPEVLVILKTRRDLFEALRARARELHPYQVPEIVALPILAGHRDYLDWLAAETRPA